MEPNFSVANAQGWNTTTHNILACHRAEDATKNNNYVDCGKEKIIFSVNQSFICVYTGVKYSLTYLPLGFPGDN